jgi:hypothetical protein
MGTPSKRYETSHLLGELGLKIGRVFGSRDFHFSGVAVAGRALCRREIALLRLQRFWRSALK